jgi:hypothetical protein
MTTSSVPESTAVPLQSPLWRGLAILATAAFSLQTVRAVVSFVSAYFFVVSRVEPPPVFTLVMFAIAFVGLVSSYLVAAALWLRRHWVPRAIVAWGLLRVAGQISFAMYFTSPDPGSTSAVVKWIAMVDWLTIVVTLAGCAVVAIVLDRALAVLPTAPQTQSSRRARWESRLFKILAVPPALGVLVMLMFLGGGVSFETLVGGGNLTLLTILALPLGMLTLKLAVDRAFSLHVRASE